MNRETLDASPVLAAGYGIWLERGLFPGWLIRIGIRRLLSARLRKERQGSPAEQAQRLMRFIAQLRQSPVAVRPDAANAQHYEVPAEFFRHVLGPHMKYSCALWNPGTKDLAEAEEAALDLACRRACLEDGQDVLELGCGWGSLSLFMARRFTGSRILAVSNSQSQKQFIDAEAARRGLTNLTVITADMNDFGTHSRFDRIVSVEMFEHMRNYAELLRRIASWSRPGALLFVHVFSHSRYAYPFEVEGASDWMAQHFFTGGVMPSDDLLLYFQEHFRIREHWRISGAHYQKTAEAWRERLERRKRDVLGLFAAVYGKDEARRWFVRWRVFFMACAELFGFAGGNEWIVSHYLFESSAGCGPSGGEAPVSDSLREPWRHGRRRWEGVRPMTYILRREQWIERPVGEVFAFFADARNLEKLTPPWLGFKVLSMSTDSVEEGTSIRYRLRLHGIPFRWRTDICEWKPPDFFVDEQAEGPYKRWRHTHRFEAHGGRTKMIDEVQYSLPFGVLGRIVHALKVRRDVGRIFDYRRRQIDALFGQPRENAP